jgi:hypothetical protein
MIITSILVLGTLPGLTIGFLAGMRRSDAYWIKTIKDLSSKIEEEYLALRRNYMDSIVSLIGGPMLPPPDVPQKSPIKNMPSLKIIKTEETKSTETPTP